MSKRRHRSIYLLSPALAIGLALQAAPAWAQYNNGSYDRPAYQNSPYVVPEGTRIIIRLDDTLDTRKLQQGKHFQAKLAEDLLSPANGDVLIPRGKKIKGHVSAIDRGFHGRILLSFDQIETRHGWIPLIATVTGVPGEHGVKEETGPEGEIERRGVDKKRALESAVVGAAIGATAGAVAGGGKGAAIGAAVGGTAGTGAGILTDRDLRLDKGQQIEIRLDRQLTVPQRG
ncbi:MAG TPA: hypothetical protein VFA60_09870 [Terriglobales bacterium]|nr:hypothetical protein [Terriglobales bacterium]